MPKMRGISFISIANGKKVLGVSNVTRKNQVPAHPDLYVVPPRMNLYMKKSRNQ